MAANRAAALAGGEQLRACHACAAGIELLGRRPALVADREQRTAETAALVEKAAASAGIPPQQLLRISPEPPQRLGESPYKEKPTCLALRGVSMEQVVKLAHALETAETGLNTKSIRLTLNKNDAKGSADTWSAEIVLSYLIYEPKTAKE